MYVPEFYNVGRGNVPSVPVLLGFVGVFVDVAGVGSVWVHSGKNGRRLHDPWLHICYVHPLLDVPCNKFVEALA